MGCLRSRRQPARRRPRRAGPPARAAPLLLEEREVGRGPAASSTTTNPASGSGTVTTTAAIPGSNSAIRATERDLALADGHRAVGRATETADRQDVPSGLDHAVDHRAGQHFVVRLTAPDGYTAARSYSVASPPDAGSAIRPHHRAARRRRGVDVPPRRRGARRRARGARAHRGLLRVGRRRRPHSSSAADRDWCR